MKTKIISLMLCFAIVLSSIIPYQLAISYSSDDETLESIGITEVATSSNAIGCDCGNEELILQNHADSCSKKTYVKDICGLDVEELADIYKESDNDIQEFILTYLSWTNQGKLSSLQEMLEQDDSDDTTEDIETVDRVEIDGAVITADGMEGTETLQVTIPDSVYDLAEDVGVSDLFVADIAVVNAISGEDKSLGSVEINIQIPFEAEETDVIHFIEDASKIRSKTSIMSVEHLSTTSQSLLANAINACYEATGIENAVAVELFEDTPVIDGTVSVYVNNFSIFAVGDVCVNTYNFYVNGTLKSTQIVIADSINYGTLFEPEAPYIKGKEFLGWKAEGSDTYQKFGSVRLDTSGNVVTNLYAEFSEPYYVYFLYEAREGADILETLSGKTGDVIYTEQVDYPMSLDKHIISWHTDIECLSPDVTEVIIGTENITLYPKVEKGFWVTFYTEGGSYIEPTFYGKNETIIEPADPYREGYEFVGWFDENGNKYEFNGQIVTESLKLTARYEAQKVNYTVQIVIQNPNKPDKYDPVLGGIYTRQGVCGETVEATDIPMSEIDTAISKLGSSSYFKKNLEYFYYSEGSNDAEEVELESDGSSVLYIYYDRYPTELRYYFSYTDAEPWKVQSGLFDGDMPSLYWLIPTEAEYPNFGNWESSPNLFPAWTGKFDYGFEWDAENEVFVHNVYATKGAENGHYFYSYVQGINPDGTVPDVGVDINNMPYRPHIDFYNPNYAGNEGNQAFINNWSDIDFETATRNDITNNDTWLLYETQNLPFVANMEYLTMFYDNEWYNGFTAVAVAFDLTHKNNGELTDYRVDNFSHRAWQSYVTYLNTGRVETGPISGSAYRDNAGSNFYYLESDKWYAIDTPFKIIKFHGDGYMRFLRNQFTLKFVMDDEVINEQEVYFETDLGLDRFTSVSDGLTPPEGYVFGGWFTSPTLTEDTRFNLETNIMPSTDLILYGKWAPIHVELDVHVTIDGTDEIIEGFNGFTVKYGSIVKRDQVDELKVSVNIPDGAIWYGWYEKVNVGGGKELLVPFNFDKQLIKDLVLYPFYSYMTPVKILYNLNGGTGEVPVDEYNYALGRGAVVLSNEDVVAPDGKYFIGWNTKADGSGKKYYPGDIAVIDLGDMTLYAQYGTQQDLVTMNYYGNETNEVVTEELLPNSIVTLVDPTETGMFEGKVYENGALTFIGWNTSPDGTGEQYLPGQQIVVTQDGENKLYAIWEHNFTNLKVSTTLRAKALENQSFVYTVIAPDGGRLKVVINIPKGKTYGEVTINNVKPGRYIIANENTWDWRYSDNNETVSITQHAVVSQPNNFDFYESRSFFKWICDCVFKGRKI